MKIHRIFITLLLLCILIPVLSLVPWLFTQRWEWPQLLPTAVSLRGVLAIALKDERFLPLVFSSIAMSTVVALLSVAIGLMTARALAFYEFAGKKWLYLLALLPFLVPGTVFGMGIQVPFLKIRLAQSFWGVVIAHLMYSLPYATKLLHDASAATGRSLEEQAAVLGASDFQSFWRVSLPLLAPALLSALSMSFIVSFSQYFLTLIIGGGRVGSFSVVMVPYLNSGERSIAAGYSLVFLCICVGVFTIFEWLVNRSLRRGGYDGAQN